LNIIFCLFGEDLSRIESGRTKKGGAESFIPAPPHDD